MAGDATLSLRDDAASPGLAEHDSLALVLHAARPLDPPACVSLADVDEVSLGRGATWQVREQGKRALRIDLPDAAVSVSHARLVRAARGFVVEDDSSKNGTLVNGRRTARQAVGAGDLLELGNCFFFLGRGLRPPAAVPPAFRTLDARLAHELDLFARVARSRVPMLLLGETGTGKEILARAAHDASGRDGPFVAVNCGAIPETLIESELFGVRKGAFSGATTDRSGMVAAAHRGTLLLDEVAELPESSQAALLRVLQTGEVVSLGATRPVQVDVRIVAATLQDLPARVAAGRFRDDLYARLRGHVLTLPPLRARRADLGLLVAELLPRVAPERAPRLVFQRAAARAMLSYAWPHNIRELEQVLSRAMALLEAADEIRLPQLPAELAPRVASGSGDSGGVAVGGEPGTDERQRLLDLVRQHAGNFSAVARELKTSRTQVQRLLLRHGIDPVELRGSSAADGDED